MMNSLISAILQVMLFSVIPFIWWLCTARKKQPFLTWIGLQKPIIVHKGRYAMYIVLSIFTMLIPSFALVFFYIDRSLLAANQFAGLGAAAVIPAFFYAIIQTGLSEELLFRGFLLKRLMKIFDFQVANLLQSIIFGCVHGAMLWSVLPLHVILLVVLTTALAGYVMGWVNERIAGGSIVTSWSIHSIVNFIAACLYMFKF
ncbi:CPBP family intramembrane glutamic endopeptidase [Lysinibacillus capsici]|uniref:CPBP family intramembrane glutamic endopeptidase n=1 Tax=Lysinibacillus capsici TaxID=2115968 RepID=UPI0039FDD7EC